MQYINAIDIQSISVDSCLTLFERAALAQAIFIGELKGMKKGLKRIRFHVTCSLH
jgi:hypothetical protein